ncbi:MAG: T9SS type A sorting domain-containing protein [Flavobacteriales bacterium]|nr:T9SS type A sorting domain-containing protein [Flavobacteriales bacterium]MCB9448729.1 T9SS type A sorting domain-containing protein [Flavobacteriales bacterium]
MKKFHIMMLMAICCQYAQATHIEGGSISYTYLGSDNYEIQLTIYKDCKYDYLAFDDTASIGIFNSTGKLVMHLHIPYSGISDTITYDPSNTCMFNEVACTERTMYKDTAYLPDIKGGYTLAYQRCCRNGGISNLVNPTNTGMTLQTFINTELHNSPPVFKQEIPYGGILDRYFQYDASATDIDGDSLVYELIAPFSGGNTLAPMPEPPPAPPYLDVVFASGYSVSNMLGGSVPLTIDRATGIMKAGIDFLGLYQIGYVVKEYRGGILIASTYRDFPFYVVADTAASLNMHGRVFVNDSNLLDTGITQLFGSDLKPQNWTFEGEQPILSTGRYVFDSLAQNNYFVKAIPALPAVGNENYLPTYFPSTPFWYNSVSLYPCDTSDIYRDISIFHSSKPKGNLTFDGVLQLGKGTYDPLPGKDLLLGIKSNDPVNNITPFMKCTTDSSGYFHFDSLASGTYYLLADFINSRIINDQPPVINLYSSLSAQVYDQSTRLYIFKYTGLNENGDSNIRVFPNPTSSLLFIQIATREPGAYSAKMYNLYGQCVQTFWNNKTLASGTYQESVSLEALPAGVYFLEISGDGQTWVQKVIRQ